MLFFDIFSENERMELTFLHIFNFGSFFDHSITMKNNKIPFQFTTGVVGYPILFILLIWVVYWFEFRSGINFNDFGIFPRTLKGLRGILSSPFIHGDITHLWHNTLPLLILSMALFFFIPKMHGLYWD